MPLRRGIKHSDVLKSDLALLNSGKNDVEAINNIESECYRMNSMAVKEMPGEATLRQRMDKYADQFLPSCWPHCRKIGIDFYLT